MTPFWWQFNEKDQGIFQNLNELVNVEQNEM